MAGSGTGRRVVLVIVFALVASLLGGAAAWTLRDGDPDTVETQALAWALSAPVLPEPPPPPPPPPPVLYDLPIGVAVPRLPVPAALPVNAHAPTPESVIGTIEIPVLGVSAPLQVGMTLTAINRGPSYWPGTAMPGQIGNTVIAGHRTTFTKPFGDLDLLSPGDLVAITTGDGRFTYAVDNIEIVSPQSTDISVQTYSHTATLFACHPKGSARQRIVAHLVLLGPDGLPLDESAQYDLGQPAIVDPSIDETAPPPAGPDPFAGTSG